MMNYREMLIYKKNVRKYIQYYILHIFLIDARYQIPYTTKNSFAYSILIDRLKKNVLQIFNLDINPKLKKNEYFRNNLKNKQKLLNHNVKKIIRENPETYNDNSNIIKLLSKTSSGNMFYDKLYYNKCAKMYKKIYGKLYPIREIEQNMYFSYINTIKNIQSE